MINSNPLTRNLFDLWTKKNLKETYIWKPGMTSWQIAEKLPEILRLVALSPPPFH